MAHSTEIPFIPQDVLRRFKVNEPSDTRFRAVARLMQSIWREEMDLPSGHQKLDNGNIIPLGSRIAASHARAGYAFLTKDIASVVYKQLVYRESGALYDEARLWENLLSSQGLMFNLFARAKSDLAYGTKLFQALFPTVARLEDIYFEHSPGRWQTAFTNDGTAFDMVAIYNDHDGNRCFIAFEIKYTENWGRGGRKTHDHLDALAKMSGMYVEATDFTSEPFAQLRAEHLLAWSMMRGGGFHRGSFCVLAPHGNREVYATLERYRMGLAEQTENVVPIYTLPLEDCVAVVGGTGDTDLARKLQDRYLNNNRVEEELCKWQPYVLDPVPRLR